MADGTCYKFDSPQRGLAVIICNEEFDHGTNLSYRGGTSLDIIHMNKMFKRLGFIVQVYKNKSKDKIDQILTKAARSDLLKECDCFACVISSHGKNISKKTQDGSIQLSHVIYGRDGELLYTKDIIAKFEDSECRSLRGKPKLFFIQACRQIIGNKKTSGFDPGAMLKVRRDGNEDKKTMHQSGEGEIDCLDTDDLGEMEDFDDESLSGSDIDTSDTSIDEISEDEEDEMKSQSMSKKSQVYAAKNLTDNLSTNSKCDKEPVEGGDCPQADLLSGHPFESMKSNDKRKQHYDEIDPPKGIRLYPAVNPTEITVIPCHNDMLVMYASPQGYYATRNRRIGSYFLYHLYKETEKHYGSDKCDHSIDFFTILTRVAYQLAYHCEFSTKQVKSYKCVPCLNHRLTKHIYFGPKPAIKTKWFACIKGQD